MQVEGRDVRRRRWRASVGRELPGRVRPGAAGASPSRRRRAARRGAASNAATTRNANARTPDDAGLRGDLQPDVVRLAPAFLLAGRVVVLELPGADPGERPLEEDLQRLAHDQAPRLARARVVLGRVRRCCPSAARTTTGRTGTAGEQATTASDVRGPAGGAGRQSTGHEHDHHPEEAAARLGEDDGQQHRARAAGGQHARTAGACRAAARRRRSRSAAAGGLRDAGRRPAHGRAQREEDREGQERHHVEREVVRVAEDPADGAGHAAVLDQVDAAHVVEDRPPRQVAGRERRPASAKRWRRRDAW